MSGSTPRDRTRPHSFDDALEVRQGYALGVLYHVYILSSHSRCLYVGITNDLRRRLHQHRHGRADAFTARYKVTRLVFHESTTDVRVAIAREKQLKRWPRWRKEWLIERENAGWLDLSAGWFAEEAE